MKRQREDDDDAKMHDDDCSAHGFARVLNPSLRSPTRAQALKVRPRLVSISPSSSWRACVRNEDGAEMHSRGNLARAHRVASVHVVVTLRRGAPARERGAQLQA